MKKAALLTLAILLSSVTFAQTPFKVHKILDITESGDTIVNNDVDVNKIYIKSRGNNVKISLHAFYPEMDIDKTMMKIKVFVTDAIYHDNWDSEKFCESKKGAKLEVRHDWLHGYIKMDLNKDGKFDHIILLGPIDEEPLTTYLY